MRCAVIGQDLWLRHITFADRQREIAKRSLDAAGDNDVHRVLPGAKCLPGILGIGVSEGGIVLDLPIEFNSQEALKDAVLLQNICPVGTQFDLETFHMASEIEGVNRVGRFEFGAYLKNAFYRMGVSHPVVRR